MSHIWNESCRTYERVMSHIWMSQTAPDWRISTWWHVSLSFSLSCLRLECAALQVLKHIQDSSASRLSWRYILKQSWMCSSAVCVCVCIYLHIDISKCCVCVCIYLHIDISKCFSASRLRRASRQLYTATHCSALQHTAAHCNTLQRTATREAQHTLNV